MNPFKNFIHVLRYYKAASIMNLIGLTLAFTAFMIIMSQVRYDFTFDRHYKHTDRMFRIAYTDPSPEGTYASALSRSIGERLVAASPDIQHSGLIEKAGRANLRLFDPERGKAAASDGYTGYGITQGTLDVFEFECVQGSFQRISTPGTLLVSQTTAQVLFGTKNPIRRQVVIEDRAPVEVVGVFRDFPDNSSFSRKSIAWNIGDEKLNDPYCWMFDYYLQTTSPEKVEKVKTDLCGALKNMKNNGSEGVSELRLEPIADIHFSRDMPYEKISRATLYSLIAVAILVILIAIVNFTNFALALAPIRIRYINTQKVLGESNVSLCRNMIVESAGMALLAYSAAILLAEYLSRTGLSALFDASIAMTDNLPVVACTAGVACLCGLLAGIYPAFYCTSFSPAMALKGSFGLSVRERRFRTTLIGSQYVISLVLIIAALSIHTLNRFMRNYDMGFNSENILIASLPGIPTEKTEYISQRLKVDVAFASSELVQEGHSGIATPHKGKQTTIGITHVSPNYLSLMGLHIVEGRNFLETDLSKDHPTLIVNQTNHLQDSVLVGEQLFDYQVVGVVEDFHNQPLRYPLSSFGFAVRPHDYYRQILIRINTPNPEPMIGYIRQTTRELDLASGGDIHFLDQDIDRLYQKEKNLSTLITTFGLLSILISVIGVFGLVLFETQYRRTEIALRKIHGSTVGEILRMFNKTYVCIVGACFMIAAPIAYWVVRGWLQNFAYRTPISPWIFGVALLIVLIITVATISLQSYKTANENPVNAIQKE